MRLPRLWLVLEASPGTPVVERTARALAGGVEGVQLRLKGWSLRDRWEVGRRLRELCRAFGVPLLVNDRIDLAWALEADGVHLPERGLPPAVARRLLGAGKLLGASVHDPDRARAVSPAVDYLIVGTAFPTPSKAGVRPLGLEGLREVVGAATVPAVAIGGIVPERVGPCLAAGAWGVAVVSGILAAPDPEAAARRYRRALDEASAAGGADRCGSG